ncbi:MAG: cysteine synthase A [Sulfitobacter sp.]|nr:MAG: cysteine synthase A [Sulfitobacter sp.]
MTKIYNNILETIGNTPVVKINKLAPKHVDLYVKVEAFNPMSSVKDRLAIGVIDAAEKDGSLKPGQTVIEATSGNTGIALAMVCAQKGYPLVITMAENFSVERRKLMRFLGAKVILTPAAEKGTGMLAKARELAEKHNWFLCRQFENEANADIHSTTTAREILADFSERGLDYWVTGFGSAGTLKGVSRVLKEESPLTKIIACEPDNSQLLGSGISQHYESDGSPAQSHPNFRPHLMQGWSPDFVPKLANDILGASLVDQIIPVDGAESLRLSRELARTEGIFCGITSGATLAAALTVAQTAPEGASILCMLPDTGERYLSTALFDEISAEMSDEEIGLSQSTPRFRFDISSGAAPATNTSIAAKADIVELVKKTINDPANPVVMYALEWCEFCWSVRKLFTEVGIPLHSVDLDSVAYQRDDIGGDIRVALREMISSPTIPQIFVGGEYVGGCTEAFDAFNEGRLQKLLTQNSVQFDTLKQPDAYGFLPTWLHPR